MHQGCTTVAAAAAALFVRIHKLSQKVYLFCGAISECVAQSHLINLLRKFKVILFYIVPARTQQHYWIFFFDVVAVIIGGNFLAMLFQCSAQTRMR